jgi:hypothetical protein
MRAHAEEVRQAIIHLQGKNDCMSAAILASTPPGAAFKRHYL